MSALKLARHRWTLLPERDAADVEAVIAAGGDGLKGGYRHGASAQTAYLAPGSLAQAGTLRRALAGLGEDFPSALAAERVFRELRDRVPDYALECAGGMWRITNRSPATFDPPFGKRDMRLFMETAVGLRSLPVPAASVLDILALFEVLAGDAPIAAVTEFAAERELDALGALLAGGMLEPGEIAPVADTGLPDFVFLGHSSFAVHASSTMVVFDPVILPANAAAAGPDRPLAALVRAAVAIVISHHHWDHLHFQTLAQLPRAMRLIVPRAGALSLANPPIAGYLRALGFTEIIECGPGDTIEIDGVTIRFFPFFGESFGLQSRFDAFTYHVSFRGRTLYGSVDACFDEAGTMEATIAAVAELGALDFFLFGSSGQRHLQPFAAGAPRQFSNELESTPELLSYHPTLTDVSRWAKILDPAFLVPYANFVFNSDSLGDLCISARNEIRGARKKVANDDLARLGREVNSTVLSLSPMQGLRFV